MKIGIDVRCLNAKNLSGVGNYTQQALRYLVSSNPDDQFYLFSSGWKDEVDLGGIENAGNVQRYHLFQSNKWLNLRILLGLGPDLTKVFSVNLDVFWLPNLNFFRVNKKIPTLITIHDLSWLHNRSFFNFKRISWHKLISIKKLLDQVGHILAVSANSQRDIIRFFGIAEDKISVVYPGIESAVMNRERADKLLASFNLPEKFWLYVGTLEPRKNILSLLKAFELYHTEYPDVELVLVGGQGWLYNKVLVALKSKPYIHYLGYVDNLPKDALYYLSQGLVWPSFYEGFGFPPLEALAQGVPVIVSYKTSLPEVMKQQALYVDPYNVSDIYQALRLLSSDQDLRRQLTKVSNAFIPTWAETASQIKKIFEQIKHSSR